MVSKVTEEEFLFLAEDDVPESAVPQITGEWHLLIVDDDEEIHIVPSACRLGMGKAAPALRRRGAGALLQRQRPVRAEF